VLYVDNADLDMSRVCIQPYFALQYLSWRNIAVIIFLGKILLLEQLRLLDLKELCAYHQALIKLSPFLNFGEQ
jgi:hypothetical protein